MGQKLTNRQIAENRLEEFLHSELDDYSKFEWALKFQEELNDKIYIDVSITNNNKGIDDIFNFYCDTTTQELYIDMYEDHWELIKEFDWQVKYFWMKFDLW